MTDRAFGGWLVASLAFHTVGAVALSAGGVRMDLAPRPAVAIEVVRLPDPEAAPPPPPPPRAKPLPPRVVPQPPAPRPLASAPAATPNLLDVPGPPAAMPRVDGTRVPSTLPAAPGPVVGAPSGVGRVFAGGDLLVAPGPSSIGGSGAPGPRGQGQAANGTASSQVAATGTGLTALARPLGGYQTKPTYPESARRDRAEGVALLRFEVLATGRVGEVVVARSAGHRDLDRAAIDAIRQWHFEPARRGPTAVAVWVTLPVRFELTER
jgi:periplasmic protein TonB